MSATTLDLQPESAKATISQESFEKLHLLFTALTCGLASLVAFDWMGNYGFALSGGITVLAFIALVASLRLRVLLQDLFKSFQYREKFLLFLCHVTIIVAPIFAFGVRDATVLASMLLIFLCIQAVDGIFYARIYFCGLCMVVWAVASRKQAPHPVAVAAWMASFLLTVRLGHTRFRLEEHSEGGSLERNAVLWGAFWRTYFPVMAGGIAWWLARRYLAPRRIVFNPSIAERESEGVFVSVNSLIWNGLGVVILCVVGLAFLSWLEKKLRSRAGAVPPEDLGGAASARRYKVGTLPDDPLIVDPAMGPRERIITAFRKFSEALGMAGLARRERETAEEYVVRVNGAEPNVAPLQENSTEPFNMACYGSEEPSAETADNFVATLDQQMQELRSALKARREKKESS